MNNTNRSQIMDQRRANGLCVYCGEKYVPGHHCLKKLMHMMQVWHNEEEQEKEQELIADQHYAEEEKGQATEGEDLAEAILSLHATHTSQNNANTGCDS
jgi:hypothetical protein